MERKRFFIGVDVGTSSVRAALFNSDGHMVTMAAHPIHIFEPEPGFYEQSSDDIWRACGICVKSIVKEVEPQQIGGIGFDATCSLVVLDDAFQPVSASPSGLKNWNVIMWMDHRAEEEASAINRTRHEVLRYVGGKISLEMQSPKLLWMKKNLETTWSTAGHFFDLPDYMTWRSTGSSSRSLCSLVCKWTYVAGNEKDVSQGWQESYWKQIGLEDIVKGKYAKIGTTVIPPGTPVGNGLSATAAAHFGLLPGTPVGASIVDAHAGAIGCLSCHTAAPGINKSLVNRLALICGTSTCHMTVNDRPLFVPGVWGPYFSAVIPGMWTNEAGQSAAGKLIDHVIKTHAAYAWVQEEAQSKGAFVHDTLNQILEDIGKKEGLSHLAYLTSNIHVWPDYHGNRSPVADPSLRGMVCGLSLSSGVEDLAKLYLATVQALAYSTKHILEALEENGHSIKVLHVCGGLSKNVLYLQSHADVTGLPLVIPKTTESVLLGAAVLGGCASGQFSSIQEAMEQMGGTGDVLQPQTAADASLEHYHSKKYLVFKKMLHDQKEYMDIMTPMKK